MPALLGMFMESPISLLIIGGIALLLFGNRLPSVMRSLGEGIVEFKKGVNGVPDEGERKKIDADASTPENAPAKTTVEQKQEVH